MSAVSGARFVCYYNSWAQYRPGGNNFTARNIDSTLCTHFIYSSAALDPNSFTIRSNDVQADIYRNGYSDFVDLKSQNPKLKLLISLGGKLDSTDGTGKYSQLASDSTKVSNFIDSVLTFLNTYGFDGLDLDWENPTASDKSNYARLIRALGTALGQRGFLFSVAASGDTDVLDNGYDLGALIDSVDFVNLLAYNMHNIWEPKADHHAPLYKRSWDTADNKNVDFVVKYFLNKGFPSEKINLGIPLFGVGWTLTSGASTAPPASAAGAAFRTYLGQESGIVAYSKICVDNQYSGWTVVRTEPNLSGPYTYSWASPVQWIGYDGPDYAGVKSRYALSMGLGGAVVRDIVTSRIKV